MSRSQAPQVLGLMGLPGAGKSHLARQLADTGGWVVLDRDRLRKGCFPDGRCDREAKRVAESLMAQQLSEMLANGQNLVLDGMTLARRLDRDRWANTVHDAGGIWRLVFLDCTAATAIERVERDQAFGQHPAADRDAKLVRQVAARLERPDHDEEACILGRENGPEAIRRWLRRSE